MNPGELLQRPACSGAPVFPTWLTRETFARGFLHVLRDDKLAAGTKQRALGPYLIERSLEGYEEFVYASPFSGFAQIALAISCQQQQLKCRIFAEADPNSSATALVPHEATRKAMAAGAMVTLVGTLDEAHELAHGWANKSPRTKLNIPLGLDDARYRQNLCTALAGVWNEISMRLPAPPPRVWVSLGSGTLSGSLRTLLPPSVELAVVDVAVLSKDDPRVLRVASLPGVRYFAAPERFCEPALQPPPLPSNSYYDAKVWRFLWEHAGSGDLWWNVAG